MKIFQSITTAKVCAYLHLRILSHCQYILTIQKDAHIVIRSPSGEADIIVIGMTTDFGKIEIFCK